MLGCAIQKNEGDMLPFVDSQQCFAKVLIIIIIVLSLNLHLLLILYDHESDSL